MARYHCCNNSIKVPWTFTSWNIFYDLYQHNSTPSAVPLLSVITLFHILMSLLRMRNTVALEQCLYFSSFCLPVNFIVLHTLLPITLLKSILLSGIDFLKCHFLPKNWQFFPEISHDRVTNCFLNPLHWIFIIKKNKQYFSLFGH